MPLLDDVKAALRITTTDAGIVDEIQDLIDSAKADLGLSGVAADKITDTDPLIKRAIITYCKANFGYDNPDADRFQRSYDLLKMHLTLSSDYNAYVIIFTVTDGTNPIKDATITIGEESLKTNSQGMAVYTIYEKNVDVDYSVYKSGYAPVTGTVYVDGQESVEVVLNAA